MFKRSVEDVLSEALQISPAVLLSGARQVGKSTLCLTMEREYRVFDDLGEREAALNDSRGYAASLPKPVTLDEIQKVPELLEGIKLDIDKERRNGTFLLTGSANVLDMKKAKETLAGRIVEVPIWPLSQKEIAGKPDENIVDILFAQGVEGVTAADVPHEGLLEAIVTGGYPEILKITSVRGRSLWFNAYISTYVERDIRDVGELRDISSFIRFYNIIAPRSCGLLNKSDLASDANLSEATVANYLSMLEMIYQVSLLNAYSSNVSKRFVKSPKLFMTDSGLYCHLLGITDPETLNNSPHKGNVFETFVYAELQKHIGYSHTQPGVYHYRTSDKKEIDFILEKGETVFAIEVKASQTVKGDAFKHIADFQKKSSKRVVGIVLYSGDKLLPFGDDTHQRYAVPISVLF